MSQQMDRRGFLRRIGVAAAAGAAAGIARSAPALAAPRDQDVGIAMDMTKCDGCPDVAVPRCVSACQTENEARFPVVEHEKIMDYWPQDKHEDWRPKKGVRTTLTPYNWTYVQKVSVEHDGRTHDLSIQRHCMHCDNPTCMALCPFGVISKEPGGAVAINPDGCMGGAKCRTVCPWGIPQRQGGVGIYLDILPKLAGGGVMYKCDLCAPRLSKGGTPACVEACRSRLGDNAPLTFGPRSAMKGLAQARARQIGGYVYGDTQNGGTGTFYVSPVPFEKIQAALAAKGGDDPARKERFFFPKDPDPMATPNLLAEATIFAPVAAIAGAVLAGAKTLGLGRKGREGEGESGRGGEKTHGSMGASENGREGRSGDTEVRP